MTRTGKEAHAARRTRRRSPLAPAAEPLEPRLLLDGGEISGTVWCDDDGDALRSEWETGIDGITVQLFDAAGGQLVASATSQSTDLDGDEWIDPATEQGRYRFADMPPGSYEVQPVVPAEWSQTSPPASYTAELGEVDSLHSPNILAFDFPDASAPDSDATLTITAQGDLDQSSEFLRVEVEGVLLADIFVADGQQYQAVQAVLTLPQSQLAGWAEDGVISIRVYPTADVSNLTGAEQITLELSYLATGRRAAAVSAGQAVTGRDFGLAPPFINRPPTLTSVQPLPGATEDQLFVIDYAALLAASDAGDPNGQPVSFRVEALGAGTLTKGAEPAAAGHTLLGAGEDLAWRPPPTPRARSRPSAWRRGTGEQPAP